MLQTRNLIKKFGGLAATDGVNLQVTAGELHAVIGPNGAGKTTLVAQISGELTPDSGTIQFAGQDVTRLPVYRRSRMGLARSFQITSIFSELTNSCKCVPRGSGARRAQLSVLVTDARRRNFNWPRAVVSGEGRDR